MQFNNECQIHHRVLKIDNSRKGFKFNIRTITTNFHLSQWCPTVICLVSQKFYRITALSNHRIYSIQEVDDIFKK